VQEKLKEIIADPKMTITMEKRARRQGAAADPADPGAGRKADGRLFPRRAAGAHHVDGRDRWHLSGGGGHPFTARRVDLAIPTAMGCMG
jgi:hypothetical protein